MRKVIVLYGSRHAGTRGIAERIGDVLRTEGLDADVFIGAFDANAAPRAMSERLVRMTPASRDLLPAGDFRDWGAIEALSREIAATLLSPLEVVAG